MDVYETLRGPLSLTISGDLYDRLHDHLFQEDDDEHGAVIGAGIAQTPSGTRLLARELTLARDGVDYVKGKRGYRMLKGEFVSDMIGRCRDERLVYLAIHNHGGRGHVAFSPDDIVSHERGYPALLDIAQGLPVGALVFAEDAIAGDIWIPNGSRMALDHAMVIGATRTLLFPNKRTLHQSVDSMYNRQARIFGDAGQAILGSFTVGIIGAGGVGALLIEFLARLGVGKLLVADPETIDATNLPRLPGARYRDAMPWLTSDKMPRFVQRIGRALQIKKVNYGRRIARQAQRNIDYVGIPRDVLDKGVIDAFKDCDFIFLAADKMQVRLLFNALVHQYLIPGAQIGSKVQVDKETGDVVDIFTIHRPLTTYTGCLWCNGAISPAKLQEESLSAEEKRNQRYVDEPTVNAPSVIGLNALGVANAVNDFMFYATGLPQFTERSEYQRNDPLLRKMALEVPRKDRDCTECGVIGRSRYGRGDARALPTRD